jgi:sterol desaturase/sphingolipid hydroxylase (fatty acid hydroxylase superfamily)
MSNGMLLGWLPLSVLVWAVQMVAFHGIGLGFEWCDRTGRLNSSKVRSRSRFTYREILPRVLFNQVFFLLPAMMLVQFAGLAFVGMEHLSPWRFIGNMVLMGVGHDVVQYITHRHLLHHPRLVRRLGHGMHHSTGANQAISACYMGGADFVLEIVLPYLLPLVLVGGGGADVLFHCLVASLGAFGGLYEHSGYDFAVNVRSSRFYVLQPHAGAFIAEFVSSHAHGEHHRRHNVSFSDGFGSPGLCDRLFGTRWDKGQVIVQGETYHFPF